MTDSFSQREAAAIAARGDINTRARKDRDDFYEEAPEEEGRDSDSEDDDDDDADSEDENDDQDADSGSRRHVIDYVGVKDRNK